MVSIYQWIHMYKQRNYNKIEKSYCIREFMSVLVKKDIILSEMSLLIILNLDAHLADERRKQ